ncbi:MAG: bifunctional methylenetetrahydrofolate dehydrogenase/methenyltetrahydrofolate cyclohydrolase FolD [Nanoarchaeota archaeon]|nr:bifunctional methylenetetrahydrofolate dehydrogenase/methenyltetrahydrofolate cyclohydrolase FolD [Nanoarchaeota archaeon]
MKSQLLDGKNLAARLRQKMKEQVGKMQPKPGLGVVLVGDNPASKVYVEGKIRACEDVGIVSKKILLGKDASESEVIAAVEEMNQDKQVHGFIVQLPLPEQIDEHLIIDSILSFKDADGFSAVNVGNMFMGRGVLLPATPKGIIRLLLDAQIPLKGKRAVVLGRSNIVGKPISFLLQQQDCTVTMCHSKTENLKNITKEADILVVAIGKPRFVTKDMVKKGAVVVDVGMHRLEDGTLCGDVDFEKVKKKCSWITPVPGGVGPMTIAMLLENSIECFYLQNR